MNVLILAAGIGRRLGRHANNQPKCLLEFGGKTLLRRHLEILYYYGIKAITIVTGFGADAIEAALLNIGADTVTTCFNSEFAKGSSGSFAIGLNTLPPEAGCLLMDADVLYDHRIIDRLINSKQENVFLLDRDLEPGEEPVKLCVRNGQLVEFGKKIDPSCIFNLQGESVGFFKFSATTTKILAAQANACIAGGDDQAPYEKIIREVLLGNPKHFFYEDITGLAWAEIDFPEDIMTAKNKILPRLSEF